MRHLTVGNDSAVGKVTLPRLLWNQRWCIWTCSAPSLPTDCTNSCFHPSPIAPSLSFLLSLTLTQWAISVAGGFYLCSQAGCRHGEGCSAPKDCVFVRTYARKRPLLRPAQPDPYPTEDLRPENSQGINRL